MYSSAPVGGKTETLISRGVMRHAPVRRTRSRFGFAKAPGLEQTTEPFVRKTAFLRLGKPGRGCLTLKSCRALSILGSFCSGGSGWANFHSLSIGPVTFVNSCSQRCRGPASIEPLEQERNQTSSSFEHLLYAVSRASAYLL